MESKSIIEATTMEYFKIKVQLFKEFCDMFNMKIVKVECDLTCAVFKMIVTTVAK